MVREWGKLRVESGNAMGGFKIGSWEGNGGILRVDDGKGTGEIKSGKWLK